MSGAGSGYELNPSTFSPDGHLFQVEYATKAVDREPVAVGVRCSDGVLLAVEKSVHSPLLTPGANPRIYWIDSSIACATVGYRPDCMATVDLARKESREYFESFGSPISIPELSARVFWHYHGKHEFNNGRPLASTLLFGSFVDGPTLYAIEPNGQYYGYLACCFGKDASLARAELQRTAWETISVRDAVPMVASVIRALPQSGGKKRELEMLWVCEASGGKPQAVPGSLFVPPE
jgi:20S proteasome subunit alpha 7